MKQMLLVSWKGTRFEVAGILRNVVDLALSKDPANPVSDDRLMNRAKAILLIGAIFKAVEPDEGEEFSERRELERLMGQAAAKRKNPKARKEKTSHGSGSGSTTPTVKA